MTQYYTYRIKWLTSNISYYGVRYKKGGTTCDLFTTYFTSSKYVHEYIAVNGPPDIIEIRQIFPTAKEAKNWEDRLIKRLNLAKHPNWLNRSNNGSFSGIIMDDIMRKKISDAKLKNKKPKRTIYNNGVSMIWLVAGDSIPDGYVKGRILSEKQKEHIQKLNSDILTNEKRKSAATKAKLKTKGRPKSNEDRLKTSISTKGKPKPWNRGENNPSKRLDVRNKISKSWENRKPIAWFYNAVTKETMWTHLDNAHNIDLTIWTRGRVPKGEWYNDGHKNLWIKFDDIEKRASNLTKGKLTKTVATVFSTYDQHE